MANRRHHPYELSNHLGNVMATITDKRLQVDNGSGAIANYTAALWMNPKTIFISSARD